MKRPNEEPYVHAPPGFNETNLKSLPKDVVLSIFMEEDLSFRDRVNFLQSDSVLNRIGNDEQTWKNLFIQNFTEYEWQRHEDFLKATENLISWNDKRRNVFVYATFLLLNFSEEDLHLSNGLPFIIEYDGTQVIISFETDKSLFDVTKVEENITFRNDLLSFLGFNSRLQRLHVHFQKRPGWQGFEISSSLKKYVKHFLTIYYVLRQYHFKSTKGEKEHPYEMCLGCQQKPATMKCCEVGVYCGSDCAKGHWSVHQFNHVE